MASATRADTSSRNQEVEEGRLELGVAQVQASPTPLESPEFQKGKRTLCYVSRLIVLESVIVEYMHSELQLDFFVGVKMFSRERRSIFVELRLVTVCARNPRQLATAEKCSHGTCKLQVQLPCRPEEEQLRTIAYKEIPATLGYRFRTPRAEIVLYGLQTVDRGQTSQNHWSSKRSPFGLQRMAAPSPDPPLICPTLTRNLLLLRLNLSIPRKTRNTRHYALLEDWTAQLFPPSHQPVERGGVWRRWCTVTGQHQRQGWSRILPLDQHLRW